MLEPILIRLLCKGERVKLHAIPQAADERFEVLFGSVGYLHVEFDNDRQLRHDYYPKGAGYLSSLRRDQFLFLKNVLLDCSITEILSILKRYREQESPVDCFLIQQIIIDKLSDFSEAREFRLFLVNHKIKLSKNISCKGHIHAFLECGESDMI